MSRGSCCDRRLDQTRIASSSRKQRPVRCRCTAITSSSTSSTTILLGSSMRALGPQPCPLEHKHQHQLWRQPMAVVPAACWQTGSSSSNCMGSRSALCCYSISNGTSSTRGSILNSAQAAFGSRQPYSLEPQQQMLQQGQLQQQWDQQDANMPRGANSRLLQQRQVQAMRGDQQQQQQQQWPAGQQDGEEGFIVPRPRFVSQAHSQYNRGNWYTAGQYQATAALHAAILDRCGRGQLETAALRALIRVADSKRDAQLALSALQAVRSVAVSRGYLAPWPDSFVKSFVRMTATCDAHEVLVSAMQRPNELGLVFKWKSLLVALKHWGDASAVGSVEAIIFALEGAGVRPDSKAAYVLVRTYINAGQLDLVPGVLTWFQQKGVTRFKPAMLNLMKNAGLETAIEDEATANFSDDELSESIV